MAWHPYEATPGLGERFLFLNGNQLLGICFMDVAPEGAVEGIGDGEKGAW